MLVNSAPDVLIASLVRRYRRGVVNSLLEFLILQYIEGGNLCGYDIITTLYDRFHVLLSPGQVYPVINYLAGQGLIHKERQGKRALLKLSSLGESLLKAWKYELGSIQIMLNGQAVAREI